MSVQSKNPHAGVSDIYVVDEESHLGDMLGETLAERGRVVTKFIKGEAFFDTFIANDSSCVVFSQQLPDMSGIDLLRRLRIVGCRSPAIMIGASVGAAMVVVAMEAGAVDVLEKPYKRDAILAGIERASLKARNDALASAARTHAATSLGRLTPRERQILDMVLDGHPSKNIACDLGISQRTVENHRASVMRKSGVKSIPALARLAMSVS